VQQPQNPQNPPPQNLQLKQNENNNYFTKDGGVHVKAAEKAVNDLTAEQKPTPKIRIFSSNTTAATVRSQEIANQINAAALILRTSTSS
jgi:hypothetical protein